MKTYTKKDIKYDYRISLDDVFVRVEDEDDWLNHLYFMVDTKQWGMETAKEAIMQHHNKLSQDRETKK